MSDATNARVEENNDPLTEPGLDKQTITNDAVAGETVIDNGHYAGPEGSEPLEAEPLSDEHESLAHGGSDEPSDLRTSDS